MLEYRYKGPWTDIQAHLTNACNHLCTHCYTSSTHYDKEWMIIECFEKIIEFAEKDDSRVIRILGGEVINPQLEVLSYLNKIPENFSRLILCTNGYTFEVWEEGKINANRFREIIISCYGFRQAHERITGLSDSFERTIRTITYLGHLLDRKFEVTVNTIVTSTNYEYFLSFLRFLSSLGVDEIKILTLSPLGHAASNRRRGYADNYIKAEMREVLLERISEAIEHNTFPSVRIVWERSEVPNSSILRGEIPKCKIHKESMVTIDSKGNVYPCHLMLHQKDFILGNLREESLTEIQRRYFESGGGTALERKLMSIYEKCPAYFAFKENVKFSDIIEPKYCPMYLELIER